MVYLHVSGKVPLLVIGGGGVRTYTTWDDDTVTPHTFNIITILQYHEQLSKPTHSELRYNPLNKRCSIGYKKSKTLHHDDPSCLYAAVLKISKVPNDYICNSCIHIDR